MQEVLGMHDEQGLDNLGEGFLDLFFFEIALSNLILDGLLQVSIYLQFGYDIQM